MINVFLMGMSAGMLAAIVIVVGVLWAAAKLSGGIAERNILQETPDDEQA